MKNTEIFKPLESYNEKIEYADIFNVEELQQIQDMFANATGVASIITKPNGTPITKPSNFCRFCNVIIRGTEKGLAKCMKSDAEIGKQNMNGPITQPCLSGGLWDAGASITVGGKHIANWLIGQVRNEELDEKKIEAYADEIGVDKDIYKAAYLEVPVMSTEKFKSISELLFTFANSLSERAYRNRELEFLILEQKETENRLRISEEKYRLLIENQNDLVVKVDSANKFIYVSPSYCKMFGKTEQELIGNSFLPLVHHDDIEETQKTMQQLYESPHTCKVVQRAMTVNGWRWFSWNDTAVVNDRGEIESVIGLGRDITERRLTELKLETSELRYRNLVENSMIGVFQSSIYGELKFANNAVVKLFEYDSVLEMIPISTTTYYKDQKAREKMVEMLRKNGHIENFEVEIITHKGNERDILMSLMLNGDQISGTIIDITERKIAEMEIKNKNEQLYISNAEKEKFFSIIAHDLRSPFNSFLGLTHLMAEDLNNMTLEQIQKLAVSMKSLAGSVNRLLENLLNWSRVKQGSFPFQPLTVPIVDLLGSCSETCIEMARNKSIMMDIDFPENITVHADVDMLQMVLRNLVSNAIKFTRQGGSVTVSARKSENNEIVFSVQDTGIGMNKKLIDSLFRIDINASRKGTDGEPSTGLGLILSKEFIEKHNGKIWVESKEGVGSTFCFSLPQIEA